MGIVFPAGNSLPLTDKSGTITAGGTAQVAIAANDRRTGFCIQNQSSGDLYINTEGTAVADETSLRIPAGSLYETPAHACPITAVSIIGATTSQAFYAREW